MTPLVVGLVVGWWASGSKAVDIALAYTVLLLVVLGWIAATRAGLAVGLVPCRCLRRRARSVGGRPSRLRCIERLHGGP